MKTVWIVNHYATDPRETASGSRHYSLARRLGERGWTTVLLAASTEHPSGKRRQGISRGRWTDRSREGVIFRFFRTPQYRSTVGRLMNILTFTWALLRWGNMRGLPRPDVVIGSTVHPLAAWAASIIARRAGVPFVFEIRDLWPQTLVDMGKLPAHGLLTWTLTRLERILCSRATTIVTLLPFAGEYLVSRGVKRDKIVWISNGTDVADFEGSPPVASETFTYMYAGSVGRANGVGAIVDGFLAVAGSDARLRLVIVGDGAERSALQDRAAGSQHGGRITFRRPVPKEQVPALLSGADVMVINVLDLDVYRYGVSMNKLFDYAASARPILIASSARNNLVRDADAGIVVPADDAQALGKAMVQMSSSFADDNRLRWAMNARSYVVANYDYRSLARRLEFVLLTCDSLAQEGWQC